MNRPKSAAQRIVDEQLSPHADFVRLLHSERQVEQGRSEECRLQTTYLRSVFHAELSDMCPNFQTVKNSHLGDDEGHTCSLVRWSAERMERCSSATVGGLLLHERGKHCALVCLDHQRSVGFAQRTSGGTQARTASCLCAGILGTGLFSRSCNVDHSLWTQELAILRIPSMREYSPDMSWMHD